MAIHNNVDSQNISSSTLSMYQTADRAIGALSGVPIVAFSTFLPLFINNAILPYLAQSWQTASMIILVLAIPVLLTFDELSSLLGVSYSLVTPSLVTTASPAGNVPFTVTTTSASAALSSSTTTISQGYISSSSLSLSELFAKITLGVYTSVFLLAGLLSLRLISHINHIHDRGGRIPGVTTKGAVMFGAGCALGAVDSAFGLVPNPIFATILLRRIIEALSRLLIIFSLFSQHMATESTHGERPSSGVSTLPPGVSYTATAAAPVRGGGRGIGQHIRKRSGIFGVIGNPRYSTFAHMQGDNPIAAAEHARVEEQRRRAGQRVTVLYDYVNPPKLEMRFSQLGIPGMAQLERAWNYAAGAASASAASLGLGGFGLGRARNESGTGTGSSGTGPRSPPIRWNTSSSHVRTMTNPTIMSSRVAIENAQPGSVPPMPMPRPMPAAQMAGPSGSGSGASPSGSRSPTRSISVRANKSLYKQRPEYFDFTYPPQQPQQSTSQLTTPMPFPFPRGSAQSQALSPTQSPPPTSGYTPRAVVRPDSDVLGSPDGNPFADQAASPLPPSSRHRPTASASQSTSSLPVPPRPSQSRSTSNLTPPEIHVSSTSSGARNPKTISTGGVTTSSSGNGQDSTLGADPEETERILAQFPETPRTGPLNLMASTSSFRQNVRGEDDTTAFGVGAASGRAQRDSNYTDVIPISLASSPGPYSAGDGTFGGHQMENTRLGLPPANPHAHTLGNLPRTPSFEGGDDGSTFLQPTPGGSSFDSGRDEARIMTVDARGRMSGIQAERASASSSTALGFGRQAQQRSIQNLSQLRARGNRGSFLDLSEATGSEFTRQDSGPFEDDPNGGETTPFDLLAVGGGPLPPAIERDSIDFPRIEAPDSSAGSDRSQDPFDDSQASGSGYGPSRVDSQVLTDADLLQPPAQMDTLPPLPASQQRLDMRHQRIPTSELAPLNVFRDRFEERRRARSSASGSEGATHSAVTDEPPSALLAASPMDMTASGSGSGKRDTGGSSVASFFLGSPSTADSSRVPRGDTRVSLSSAMMPTGVHPERGQWSATVSATPPTSGGPGTGQGFSAMMSGPGESPLVPPQRGAAWSNMDSERKTPSPDVVPSEIEDAERRGSVMFGVAR